MQITSNSRSFALFAKLGFEVRGLFLAVASAQGRPLGCSCLYTTLLDRSLAANVAATRTALSASLAVSTDVYVTQYAYVV